MSTADSEVETYSDLRFWVNFMFNFTVPIIPDKLVLCLARDGHGLGPSMGWVGLGLVV